MIIKLVRLALTILLLVLVWMNSHWSVALTLTLLAVTNEALRSVIAEEKRYRKDREKAEFRLFKRAKKLRQELDAVNTKLKTYEQRRQLPPKQPKA